MYRQNIGSLTWGRTISYSLDIRVLMWIAFFPILPNSVDRLHDGELLVDGIKETIHSVQDKK